jgi:hypothetical protein
VKKALNQSITDMPYLPYLGLIFRSFASKSTAYIISLVETAKFGKSGLRGGGSTLNEEFTEWVWAPMISIPMNWNVHSVLQCVICRGPLIKFSIVRHSSPTLYNVQRIA